MGRWSPHSLRWRTLCLECHCWSRHLPEGVGRVLRTFLGARKRGGHEEEPERRFYPVPNLAGVQVWRARAGSGSRLTTASARQASRHTKPSLRVIAEGARSPWIGRCGIPRPGLLLVHLRLTIGLWPRPPFKSPPQRGERVTVESGALSRIASVEFARRLLLWDSTRRPPEPASGNREASYLVSVNTTPCPRVLMVSALRELADGELVERSCKGDADAFGVLVERYMRAAYAVALSVLRRHEDAQDAVQESFLVALQRLEECRSPQRFAGWLITIVRNRSRNIVRRETLRDTDPVPESARSKLPTPERELESSELRGRLAAALDQLSEIERQIVLLHDLEGWKHREIADLLDLPSGTVRSHLHFARKKLRGALAGLHGDNENETATRVNR